MDSPCSIRGAERSVRNTIQRKVKVVKPRALVASGLASLRKQGIRATRQHATMYLGQRFLGARPDLVQHRYSLSQQLSRTLNDTIAYGPFAGTRLSTMSHWSAADRGGMLLGIYEQEVLAELERLSQGRDVLIDVGAADGYYAIGSLVAGLFEQAVCFEIDPNGQDMIRSQAEVNGIAECLTVLGIAGGDFVQELRRRLSVSLSQCVVLMDIEGGEFSLLTESVLANLSDTPLIIELHDFLEGSSEDEANLLARIGRYYEYRLVEQGARNPNLFPELKEWSDDDRWLLCSESRQCVMKWIVCTPRSSRDQ